MDSYSKGLRTEGSFSSSESSTPEHTVPFQPKFEISFSDKVTKDGDTIMYRIQVLQGGFLFQEIERIYEDFEYLEHCVITDQPFQGLIIPPLPCQLPIDAQAAEIHSKKHMGKNCRTLLGDDFKKTSAQLQRYLELLLMHPILGKSPRLQEFLVSKDPPPRTKIRKGLLDKLSDTLEARKVSYPDSEDFFQRERDWISKYSPAIEDFAANFSKIIISQVKITHQLEQMVLAYKLNNCMNNLPPSYSNLKRLFLRSIEISKNELEEKCLIEDCGPSCDIDLWLKYVQAEEAMLLRRTSLMIDYQACNRALDKAKPNRKLAAEMAKKDSEAEFERCSDDARREIKRFQVLRSDEMLKAISSYVQHQISCTRDSINHLSSALAMIKSVPLHIK